VAAQEDIKKQKAQEKAAQAALQADLERASAQAEKERAQAEKERAQAEKERQSASAAAAAATAAAGKVEKAPALARSMSFKAMKQHLKAAGVAKARVDQCMGKYELEKLAEECGISFWK